MDSINKLYSVQFINHISGNHGIIGVFRDERIANEFAEDRNKMLLNKMLTKNILRSGFRLFAKSLPQTEAFIFAATGNVRRSCSARLKKNSAL